MSTQPVASQAGSRNMAVRSVQLVVAIVMIIVGLGFTGGAV